MFFCCYILPARDIWNFFAGIYLETYKSRRLKRDEIRFFNSGMTRRHFEDTTSKSIVIFVMSQNGFKAGTFFQKSHLPVGGRGNQF